MSPSRALEDWATWAFSPAISAILITLLVSLTLPVLLHWYLYRQAKKGSNVPTFLLVGPSGSGKTGLLTLFAHGSAAPTHTSQTPQSALCQLPAATKSAADRYRAEHDPSARDRPSFLLLDTPGHGKLRHHALSPLSAPSSATLLKGVIFVVDSAAADWTEAATYLHDVLLVLQKRHTLSPRSKSGKGVDVLVACNKQDVFTSLPPVLVKRRLEEEIANVRRTRSKGLLDSGVGMGEEAGGVDEEVNWLGEYGSKVFEFGQMEEYGVEICVKGGSVKGEGEEEARVGEWWDWVGEHL